MTSLLLCLFFSPKNYMKCFEMKLTIRSVNTCGQVMSAPVEILTRAITGSLCWASLLDGANQDHDYSLAHAASLRCLETCFPKETTEGQLLSAELFSLLSMCVLAACLWPTDPEQRHETGPPVSLLFFPTAPPRISNGRAIQICTLQMSKMCT